MELIKLLEKTVLKYPEKTAIIDAINDKKYSYKTLLHDVKSLSYIFYKNGITPGNKITLFFNNSYYQIISFFSLLYIGAIPVLIDGNSCIEEILKFLKYSESNVMIGEIEKIDIFKNLFIKKVLFYQMMNIKLKIKKSI